jgi:hypothetical protein
MHLPGMRRPNAEEPDLAGVVSQQISTSESFERSEFARYGCGESGYFCPRRCRNARLGKATLDEQHAKVGLPTVALGKDTDRPPSRLRRYGGQPSRDRERRLVDQNSASWNQVFSWLHRISGLMQPA